MFTGCTSENNYAAPFEQAVFDVSLPHAQTTFRNDPRVQDDHNFYPKYRFHYPLGHEKTWWDENGIPSR